MERIEWFIKNIGESDSMFATKEAMLTASLRQIYPKKHRDHLS
jgi:hypothetical protein